MPSNALPLLPVATFTSGLLAATMATWPSA
jgi:hypothetical protein